MMVDSRVGRMFGGGVLFVRHRGSVKTDRSEKSGI